MRSSLRFVALLALQVGAGCDTSTGLSSGDEPDLSVAPGADMATPPPPPSDLAFVVPTDFTGIPVDLVPPPPSGIGKPCTTPGWPAQGTCAVGQKCLASPQFMGFSNGYCTADCDVNKPCPDDASCVHVYGATGSFCFLSCTLNTDCRNGYSCGGEAACMPGGVAGDVNVPVATKNGAACVQPVLQPGLPDGGVGGFVFGKNTQVSSGLGEAFEAETQLAVDPKTQRIVSGYIMVGGHANLAAAHSLDDGSSWIKEYQVTANNMINMHTDNSDPVMAVDPLGYFYIAWVAFNRDNKGQPISMNVYVARSTNSGASFDQVTQVTPANEYAMGGGLDKPWIAASPVDGSIWVTWDRMQGGADIRLSRSVDQGKTWTKAITISETQARGEVFRNLPQITVGADGRPVVAWVEIALGGALGWPGNQVYVQRIAANGTLSGKNIAATGGADSPTFDDPSVATFGNNVYVGFASGGPDGRWDIRAAASVDGGATFKPSVKVNDDATCATHYHHQIAVDAKGNVHAAWYDNRYLAGNVLYALSPPASANANLAFGKNQFVNDAPFTFTTRRDMSNWLGDYLGLTSVGGEVYASWADNRKANTSHVFFAKGKTP